MHNAFTYFNANNMQFAKCFLLENNLQFPYLQCIITNRKICLIAGMERRKSYMLNEENANGISDDEMKDVIEHVFDDEDVVIDSKIEIPEEFTPCSNKEELGASAYLGTNDVANMLGVHRNIVLNYTNAFYEFLSVSKNPQNNRFKYTEESVKQLAFLINDRRNNSRTLKQEKDYILSKTGGKAMNIATRNVETLEKMFNTLQENIIENNKQMFQQMLAENNLLLSQLNEENSKAIALLESSGESTKQQYEEQLRKQEEEYDKIIIDKNKEIEELRKELAEKNKKRFLFF